MFSTVLKYDTLSVLNDINFIEKVVYTCQPFHWRLNDTKWTNEVVETIDNIRWKIVFTSFNKQTSFGGRVEDNYLLKIFYSNKRLGKVNISITNFVSRFRMKKVHTLPKCAD